MNGSADVRELTMPQRRILTRVRAARDMPPADRSAMDGLCPPFIRASAASGCAPSGRPGRSGQPGPADGKNRRIVL